MAELSEERLARLERLTLLSCCGDTVGLPAGVGPTLRGRSRRLDQWLRDHPEATSEQKSNAADECSVANGLPRWRRWSRFSMG